MYGEMRTGTNDECRKGMGQFSVYASTIYMLVRASDQVLLVVTGGAVCFDVFLVESPASAIVNEGKLC